MSRAPLRRTTTPRVALLAALLVLPACAGGGDAAGSAASRPVTGTPERAAGPSAAPPSPTPDPAAERVAAALADLDRRAQVAQLFVVGVPLADLASGDPLAGDVGGLFLAGRSRLSAADLAEVTRRWREAARGPLPWIAVDQEGGSVQALSGDGFDPLPSAAQQGDLPRAELAALADELGADLARAGIDLDLAPVADVVPAGAEAGNAPIGAFGRQYGSTAAEVAAAASVVIRGLAAHDVTATLKHFPGLGRVQGNTDEVVDVTDTVTAAGDAQVELFAELADSPAHPFVMTSSATYARIDPTQPAAWSRAVVTDLLREDLGFDGVVVSDDLGAAAAVQGVPPGERAVRFLQAGGTLVLTVTPAVHPAMVEAVLDRDRRDPAFRRQVDEAVTTALEAKERAGLLGPPD